MSLPHAAAQRVHGRAAIEDATQNTLREFLQSSAAAPSTPNAPPACCA
jgi:hypothetical protein